jgi:hypothetical protein
VKFDYFLILVFVCAQWRISALCLRAGRRQWSERRQGLLRAAVLAFDALLAFGYFCTLNEEASRLRMPGWLAGPMGGVALFYLLAATAVLAIYEVLRLASRRLDAETNPARRRLLQTGGAGLMAAPFAALGYGMFIERLDFRVREVEVPLAGLAADLDGLRILQLSDIHLSAFLSEADLARVVDAARELQPHLAVVTGDLISSRGDPLDACIRQLARLKTDAGVFGCLGNHERYARAEDYATAAAARVGIDFLRQRSRRRDLEPRGRRLSAAKRPRVISQRRRAPAGAGRRQRAPLAQSGRISGSGAPRLPSDDGGTYARRPGHGGDSRPVGERRALFHTLCLRAVRRPARIGLRDARDWYHRHSCADRGATRDSRAAIEEGLIRGDRALSGSERPSFQLAGPGGGDCRCRRPF